MKTEPSVTPRMHKAIGAILATSSQEEAATAAGCSSRQIRRYLGTPIFMAELRRARSSILDAVASQLATASSSCVRVLVEIANGKIAASPTRCAAAKAVLDLAARWEEPGAVAMRMSELEDLCARRDGSGRLS